MATLTHQKLRRALIGAARAMETSGLNVRRAGNASVRAGKGFLVTPSGMDPQAMTPADAVEMDFDGTAQGRRKPSSEWPFHGDILAARPEFGAVLHIHSPYATALACLRRPLPPFHYMLALMGGTDVRCAGYATFGSKALSRNALKALKGRSACLLANHGAIVCGTDLDDAFGRAVELESLVQQYLLACAAGKPVLLTDAQMADVLEKAKGYGQQ